MHCQDAISPDLIEAHSDAAAAALLPVAPREATVVTTPDVASLTVAEQKHLSMTGRPIALDFCVLFCGKGRTAQTTRRTVGQWSFWCWNCLLRCAGYEEPDAPPPAENLLQRQGLQKRVERTTGDSIMKTFTSPNCCRDTLGMTSACGPGPARTKRVPLGPRIPCPSLS